MKKHSSKRAEAQPQEAILDAEELQFAEEAESDPVKRYMISAAVVIGVLFLVWIGVDMYLSSQQESREAATAALSQVRPYYQNGQYANALSGDSIPGFGNKAAIGLQTIVKRYGDTEAGKLAALYAGQSHRMLGNFSEAEEYFNRAKSAESPLTRIGALAGLGACKAESGSFAAAAEMYEQAATLAETTGNSSRYQLYAAMLREKDGDKDGALRLYREIIADNQFSEFAGEAKSGVARLGETIQ